MCVCWFADCGSKFLFNIYLPYTSKRPKYTLCNSKFSYLINNTDTYSLPVIINAVDSVFSPVLLSRTSLTIFFFPQREADKSENKYSARTAKYFRGKFVTFFGVYIGLLKVNRKFRVKLSCCKLHRKSFLDAW